MTKAQLLCTSAVTAQKGNMYVEQHHNPFDRLADDRPVAAMPPHPAEGVGAEGGLQGLPRSGGRPQSRRP